MKLTKIWLTVLFNMVMCLLLTGCDTQAKPVFDGNKAFSYLQKQCDFGPRVPGSTGHAKCRDYLVETLSMFADNVSTQPFMFTFSPPVTRVNATNIIANFQPNLGKRILLCAHWDTRPWADMDANSQNHTKPILGANDGGSGVAVLLEVARLLHEQKPQVGVDIILFDGEDAGHSGQERSYAKGSAAFAKTVDPAYRPVFGILLDMIGDADLNIYMEGYSQMYAPHIVEKVWLKAAELGIHEMIPQVKYSMFDDHVPLLEAGIPCIDIIDFDYPYWHTIEDTPDKCSAESLGKIGKLLVAIIYDEK